MNRSFFYLLSFFLIFLSATSISYAQTAERDFYELRQYHYDQAEQENLLDNFLKNALLPALKRAGVSKTGVFKPIETDSSYGKTLYVLIPYKSLQDYVQITDDIYEDEKFLSDGKDYIDAPHDNPPYERFETVLLRAFKGMPNFEEPQLSTPASERIYELRSYEAATEKLFRKKVEMFDEGETEIFDRLGFNAVFYGEVIAGCKMPNLMYMTTHENMAAREENWDNFRSDSKWEEMSSLQEYANTVSHADIMLLRPTDYSGI